MHTKLSRICDAIIEAGWLAAVVVTPLFFNTHSYRVFEPDKAYLLRSIALLMAVAWLVQLLDSASTAGWAGAAAGGRPVSFPARLWRQIRTTPFVLPALVLVLSYVLSTALSVVPRISFFGSHVRLQGTLTFLCYVAVSGMVLTHLRRPSQVRRLLFAIVLTSVPISIYAIMQRYNLDPLPWGGDVRERVAANMGNAIFVAAYLIMAAFIALERLVDSVADLLDAEKPDSAGIARAAAYFFALIVILFAILLTQSRGAWIGLVAGLVLFLLVGVLLLARRAKAREVQADAAGWPARRVRAVWFGLLGVLAAAGLVLGLMNVPDGPLKSLCKQRYVSRLCTLTSRTEGTNAVRVLIWQGVVDLMLKPHAPLTWPDGSADSLNALRPLVGYGPESMWVAYNSVYPPELAYYESRSASADSSHNATFDALERGGLLQAGAELVLVGSVFYYSLRWLGLAASRRRRGLLIGLLIGGAAFGAGLLALLDGSVRLAGIGIALGMGLGIGLYLIVEAALTPLGEGANGGAADGGAANGGAADGGAADGIRPGGARRALLVLALYAAIAAHFFEVAFGLAIVATLTYFWVLIGALAAIGMGWVREDGPAAPAPEAVRAAAPAAPAFERPADAKKGRAGGQAQKAGKAADRRRQGAAAQARGTIAADARRGQGVRGLTVRAATPPVRRSEAAGSLLAFLPYAFIMALVTLVLTWDYIPQNISTGADTALSAFWDSFTARADAATYQVVRSPMLLVLMLFTWLIGGMAALAESGSGWRGKRLAAAVCSGLALVLGVWLIYGLIQGGRVTAAGLSGLDVYIFATQHIVVFYAVLLLLAAGLAVALWFSDERPRPQVGLGAATPIWAVLPPLGPIVAAWGDEALKRGFRRIAPLVYGAAALVLAVLVIANVNLRGVRADGFYKQGINFEASNQWEGAAILYREALRLQPREDNYYLFLGRALVQVAETSEAGDAVAAANLDKVATEDLLDVVDSGMRSRSKEDRLRAAHAALVAARRYNPLNTDHSANLARMQRAWAFVSTDTSVTVLGNGPLRELVLTEPETIGLDHLEQSEAYYLSATRLSPQNVTLRNELATVQIIRDKLDDAQATLERSLAIDPRYAQTYLIQGDLRDIRGDKEGALEAFRQAAALSPSDLTTLGAIGEASAQLGDINTSVAAYGRIVEIQKKALAAAERQLANLDAQASRAGGYTQLLPTAAVVRADWQSKITGYRYQVYLGYARTALWLRDAGRKSEALDAARQAIAYADESQKPGIQALIAELLVP